MKPWYLESKDTLPARLRGVLDRIIEQDGPRLEAYNRYGQLYGGRRRTAAADRHARVRGITLPGPAETTTNIGAHSEDDIAGTARTPLRINVIKAAIDTVVSKVGKLRPRPTFLTSGGNWSAMMKAKQLQRFMDGAFLQSDAYMHGMDVFRDGMVYGTGVILPYGRGAEVKRPRLRSDRPPVWEFFVDEDDAEYGQPMCLYRERYVSRERIRQVWGPNAIPAEERIADDGNTFHTHGTVVDDGDEFLRVLEAWYRPRDPSEVVPDGKVMPSKVVVEGRHVIVVGSKVVEDDYFPYGEFPPVFFHWSKPTYGFWGDSAIREVEGIQIEINALLKTVQDSMRLTGQPMVFVHEDSNLTPKEMNNKPGQHYTYGGQIKPEVVTFQAVSPQHVNHLWQLYSKAFEILGSNQLAASATAPPGLESGRALERLSEEHSERFMAVSRAFNYAIGEQLARRFILLAKQLDGATKGGFALRAPVRKTSDRIKWSEVSIDPDDYVMQVFDTSVLPTLPSARVQEVERLQSAQVIDAEEARRLLDFPDLEVSNSFATADYDNLLWQFERMLEHGDAIEPEPYQDLQRAIRIGQAAVLRAQRDGCPPANIDQLRRFVDIAVMLDMEAQAAAAPPPAPEGGAPAPDRRDDVLSMAAAPDQLPVA